MSSSVKESSVKESSVKGSSVKERGKERKMGSLFAGFGGVVWGIIPILLIVVGGLIYSGGIRGGNVLSADISKPLDGATSAKVDVDADSGNLTIDSLAAEQVLASGTLQYFENQGAPVQAVSSSGGQATLTLKGGGNGLPSIRLPWSACVGAYEWQIHLNPAVASDVTAHSGGGNVKLDLAGMALTRLSADTGGGNVDVVLPDSAANLSVLARTGGGNVSVEIGSGTTGTSAVDASSGAGNVVVDIPTGVAARIHTSTGLGKAIVDPRYSAIDRDTYQSSDFDGAANRVEITAKSGAGNVVVNAR